MAFLNKTATKRKLFFLLADVILISLSILLAFYLRFGGEVPSRYIEKQMIQQTIALALFFCLPIFYFFGLYSFSWSYVSARELVSLFKATTISFFFVGISFFVLKTFNGFPRSVLFISYFLTFIFCGGIRFAKRVYLEMVMEKKERRENSKKKTLIVGAGDVAEQILRNILSSESNLYFPLGIVDDNYSKQGIVIHGVKVLGRIEDIPNIVREKEVKQMIVALPSKNSNTIKKAVEFGRKAGIKNIKVIPSTAEMINEEVSIKSLREIQVEDLMERNPVELDTRIIKNFIKEKIILISGAAGSIGSELSRQVAKFKPSLLLLLDQDETGMFNISEELKLKFPHLKIKSLIADITDEKKINYLFNKFKPFAVFHAAAYKHVPLMEENPDEAIKNNIFGTKILATASLRSGVIKFIFISTDKAVNPVSIMGATKKVGEMICQFFNQKNLTKFISVRFGNVLNSRGSVIPIFKKQIEKGGPVTITHPEMERYFMTIPEACLLVMQSGAMGGGGEVFILDMGKPIKILNLAKEMIRFFGFEPDKDIPIVFSGIRPGEKLFEEILTAEEGVESTYNKKIFKTKLSPINNEELNDNLKRLEEAIKKSEKDEIIGILKRMVCFKK